MACICTRLINISLSHIATTDPTHPPPPSEELAARTHSLNTSTATLADATDSGANAVGDFIHQAGKTIGSQLPDSIAKASETPKEEDKSDIRKMAETNWQQVTIAAQAVAKAGFTVGGALSESAHRAVEHSFGKEADKVAQGEYGDPA